MCCTFLWTQKSPTQLSPEEFVSPNVQKLPSTGKNGIQGRLRIFQGVQGPDEEECAKALAHEAEHARQLEASIASDEVRPGRFGVGDGLLGLLAHMLAIQLHATEMRVPA